MATTLVNGLADLFKSQGLEPFAVQAGESQASVFRGFQATVGTMVTRLSYKLGQTGFARQIFDLVNSPSNDPRVLDNIRNLVTTAPNQSKDVQGSRLLSMLFDGQQSVVTDEVSRASGLRTSSAASLLTLGAPLLLGWLGKRVREGGMDASRLSSLLSQEAASVRGTLPEGVTTLLGPETANTETVPPIAEAVVHERSRRWLWPVVLALLAVALLIAWLYLRSSPLQQVETAARSTAGFVTRNLPGSIQLNVPAGKMEDQVLAFIQDPSKQVDETTWFDFDRLLFDTNSATLQPSSQEQLHNVAAILKAYPNVHLKIGGYTDNTGDPSDNQRLSQQRADNVKQELINMGVSADRLEAVGYGDQHPVADNSTEEGRQKNRRISLRVTQK